MAEFEVDEKKHDDRVAELEATKVSLDQSFAVWKPEVEASISSIKLELSKLKSYFDCDAKDSSASKTD
jgi:hypothetical protein